MFLCGPNRWPCRSARWPPTSAQGKGARDRRQEAEGAAAGSRRRRRRDQSSLHAAPAAPAAAVSQHPATTTHVGDRSAVHGGADCGAKAPPPREGAQFLQAGAAAAAALLSPARSASGPGGGPARSAPAAGGSTSNDASAAPGAAGPTVAYAAAGLIPASELLETAQAAADALFDAASAGRPQQHPPQQQHRLHFEPLHAVHIDDGVPLMPLLCRLARARSAASLADPHYSATNAHEETADAMLLAIYAAACKRLGMRCVFAPGDLEGGGDFSAVIDNLVELRALAAARAAAQAGAPSVVQFGYAEAEGRAASAAAAAATAGPRSGLGSAAPAGNGPADGACSRSGHRCPHCSASRPVGRCVGEYTIVQLCRGDDAWRLHARGPVEPPAASVAPRGNISTAAAPAEGGPSPSSIDATQDRAAAAAASCCRADAGGHEDARPCHDAGGRERWPGQLGRSRLRCCTC